MAKNINRQMGRGSTLIMVRTPVAARSNVCQTLSRNALVNFLKPAVVSPDTSWTTGCRPGGKQTDIGEFNLSASKTEIQPSTI